MENYDKSVRQEGPFVLIVCLSPIHVASLAPGKLVMMPAMLALTRTVHVDLSRNGDGSLLHFTCPVSL